MSDVEPAGDGPARVFVVTAIVPAHDDGATDDGSTVRFLVQEFPPSRGVCVYASVRLDSPAVELQESIAAVLEEGAGCAPTLHWGWDDGHWPMDGGGGGTLVPFMHGHPASGDTALPSHTGCQLFAPVGLALQLRMVFII